MTYMGIDPGKSGALAVITAERKVLFIIPFSREGYLRAMQSCPDAVCCLEHVGAMPGQGVTSMFSFGENFGWIQGVLESERIAYQLVRPKVWKKDFSLDSSKQASVEAALRLFPGANLRRSEQCRKDDDGMAEALLMAEYARRKF